MTQASIAMTLYITYDTSQYSDDSVYNVSVGDVVRVLVIIIAHLQQSNSRGRVTNLRLIMQFKGFSSLNKFQFRLGRTT